MNKELYRNDWIELSDDWGFHYKLSLSGHYDERPVVSFYLTSVLSILVLTPLLLWLGLGWWTAVVVAPLALYGWGWLFVTLPFKTGVKTHESESYGIYFLDRGLWFPWGSKIHNINMPWAWVWKRRSVLAMESIWPEEGDKKAKLVWLHSTPSNNLSFWREEYREVFWGKTQMFVYNLRNGEDQYTKARIRVEEFEHRWKILAWCPWFARVERYIDIRFDDPVGEGVGTYKGGVFGTGMKMKEGEHPSETFRRFEEKADFRR